MTFKGNENHYNITPEMEYKYSEKTEKYDYCTFSE